MTELVVRRLLIDLETPLERHWCGGNAFATAFFNALSMSFPVGEQFFIDSVRNGLKALPLDDRDSYADDVQAFVGQEATHRRIHSLFNAHLANHGLVNDWAPRAAARMKLMDGVNPLHPLALTAANEHFTAIFAEWMLGHPAILEGTEDRLKNLWLWHCAEEAEHKNTAFDLYRALGGNNTWRIKWFRRVTLIFVADTLRQTVNNLRHDGSLWRWRTWREAASFLFGHHGLVRHTWWPWCAYFKPGFHPHDQDSSLSARWLQDNANAWAPVGRSA